MNVFLISNMYPDSSSPGFGVFVKNVVDGLEKNGIHVKYSSLIKGQSKSKLGKVIKYIRFYASICLNFFRTYDLIYIHFPNHALPLLLPLLFIKKRIVVANLHGEDLLYKGLIGNFLGRLNDSFLTQVDKIIVPSNYFKNEVLNRHLSSEDKIFISPSGGIDNNIFFPQNKQYIKDRFCIGYVGRIEEGKGVREFVETLYEINKRFFCEAIIIGYGPFESELLEMLVKYSLTDKVKIIKGLDQNRLCDYYSTFDLFLFLSKRKTESLGLVGIESMACGTPVIGTSIGGIPSYLVDGYNGFLVPNDDSHAVVEAVIKYHSISGQERSIMKNNAIETSKKYFRDEVCEDLSKVFYKLKV
jgi:glycosyltransferase involved in cell wall biosynthesis